MSVGNTLPTLGSTTDLFLHDPTGGFGSSAFTAFAIAAAPLAGFPCGSPIPGHGLNPGAGELLINPPFPLFNGPNWTGTPARIALNVPNSNSLVGQLAYLQGVLFDATRAGLTDAVELKIGR